ncbi:hypothetical protein [Calidithermus terrae]|uniref:hypothetical protein n=1 Tax=Calidithermus terrae TaxID=1408545 RepID=UPI000E6481FA|nr:hypothetical protein [Calidithermus terrae]
MNITVEEVLAVLAELRFWLLILVSFLVWYILTWLFAQRQLDLANPKDSALRAMGLAIPFGIALSLLVGLLVLQVGLLRLVMAAVISAVLLLTSRTLISR